MGGAEGCLRCPAPSPGAHRVEWTFPSSTWKSALRFWGDRGAEVLAKPAYSFTFYSLNLGKAV